MKKILLPLFAYGLLVSPYLLGAEPANTPQSNKPFTPDPWENDGEVADRHGGGGHHSGGHHHGGGGHHHGGHHHYGDGYRGYYGGYGAGYYGGVGIDLNPGYYNGNVYYNSRDSGYYNSDGTYYYNNGSSGYYYDNSGYGN